jgi:hypothetical protein
LDVTLSHDDIHFFNDKAPRREKTRRWFTARDAHA